MHCSVTWRRPRTLGRTKEPWGVKKTVSWVNDGRRFLGQQIRSWPDPESTMGRLRQRQAIWNQRELTDPQERSLAGADWLLWWSKSLASQYHLCEDIEETEEKKKGQRKKRKKGGAGAVWTEESSNLHYYDDCVPARRTENWMPNCVELWHCARGLCGCIEEESNIEDQMQGLKCFTVTSVMFVLCWCCVFVDFSWTNEYENY